MAHRMNSLIWASSLSLGNDPGIGKQILSEHLGSVPDTQKSNISQTPVLAT